jgi:sugar phosphate isomerase/epimerase
MNQNRREFISTIVAGAAMPMVSSLDKIFPSIPMNNYQIHLFSKPLDSYDFDFTCECCKLSGISGLDLTVRKDGRVEPESVESALPEYIKKASKYNLSTDMIVTGILSAADPFTERILRTASQLGVKYYRLGWFSYDNTDIWETLQKYKSVLSDLAALNRKYNIHGGYQNHSGTFVGASLWDLNELFRDLPSEYIGSQFDVRHAMVEGYDTWIIGMRLISKYIKTLAVKDFTWNNVSGKQQPVTVPLGEGLVDWDLYFSGLKELDIVAPITLHIEYPLLENGEEKLSLIKKQEIIVNKLKKDRDFINSYLRKYQLI